MAYVQLIFAERSTTGALARLRYRVPFTQSLARWIRRRPTVAPMEMNPYDLGTVLSIFQDAGHHELKVSLNRMGSIRSVNLVSIRPG